jgi:hypothetical protein
LLPIWDALPDDVKLDKWQRGDTLLIAGFPDIRHLNPYIYVEHGAGQSYQGVNSGGWSGGEHHHEARMFICPNENVAERWRTRYPDKPAVVVGCPRLDKYHTGYAPPERTVAFTFHWDCQFAPETRSAWPHYKDQMHTMVQSYREQGWTVLGHSHPRYADVLSPAWKRLGVEWTDDPLRDATVLVADNTSMMAEFLSCGRPVVALNAPWYRRDVHHGMRFWEWDVTYADTALEASQIDLSALRPPAHHPYAFNDGQAAQRASQAILDLIR